MNFISELTMSVEFGVGAEAKVLKKNDYLSFNVSALGKTTAKILRIGWINDDGFVTDFIPDGVNLDFIVDVSGTFLGRKLEVTPFYERFILIKPQK